MDRNRSNLLRPEWFTPWLAHSGGLLRPFVDLAFQMNIIVPIEAETDKKAYIRTTLQSGRYPQPQYQGQHLIIRDVITYYLTNLLRLDARMAPFTLVGTEQDVDFSVTVDALGESHELLLGGRIDRLDRLADGTLRVVDYKTGTPSQSAPTLDAAFSRDLTHQSHTFQALLYAHALMSRHPEVANIPLHTALLYIRQAHNPDYDPTLRLSVGKGGERDADFRPLSAEFNTRLQVLLSEILSIEQPFEQTEQTAKCRTCPFALLCNRSAG